jgi:hypothetical protein
VLILVTLISLFASHFFSQSLIAHRTAKSLSDTIQGKHEKALKLKIKMTNLIKDPDAYSDSFIGFVPDHLELGCPTGVSLYRLTELPYQSVVAIRLPSDEVKHSVYPYLDVVYVGKTKKPCLYALAKDGQVHQLDAKTETIMASCAVIESSAALISGHIVANELFYERRWHTVLTVVANFFREGQLQQSKSIIKMFDITAATDVMTSPEKVFSMQKQIYLNPILNQLIKPAMIRLPKEGFGFAIGGMSVETGKPNVQLVFLDGASSVGLPIPDKHIFYLTASDTKQTNYASHLSIAADNVYQIDFTEKNPSLKKLAELTCALPPFVVQSTNGPQVNMIVVGTGSTTGNGNFSPNLPKGLFRIYPNAQIKLLGNLEPNHYQTMQCRWGFMRLHPNQSGAMIKELDLSYDELRTLSPDDKWSDEKKYGQISFCKLN